ncbi:MAG TPA: signal peptidase I [Candidatus Acidoferrales bacterium]
MDQQDAGRIAAEQEGIRRRVWIEVVSWLWVIAAFIAIEAGVAQARMIPSGSMEPTVLVGDHLLVSRVGYDLGIPFTSIREPLWREPKRQEIIVFQAPLADQGFPDFIKRCIGIPGDRIKIVAGTVYVNGKALDEPYVKHLPGYRQLARENFPAYAAEMAPAFVDRPEWAEELAKNSVNGELIVPPGEYFMMGDNRDDSNDSRYWGFTSRASIIGRPVMVYMSIDEPEAAWDSGHLGDRFEAYAEAAIHPDDIRWRRLFHIF